jgi:hypothetical protein
LFTKLVAPDPRSISHPDRSRIDRDFAREGESADSGLAFPYGDYDPQVIELCRAAGYDFVFTIFTETVDVAVCSIVRGRVNVQASDGLLEVFMKFKGAQACMP